MNDARIVAAIADICAVLNLPTTGAQHNQLGAFLSLLARWNETYNLTAIRATEEMLRQHLADCLAVVPAFTKQLAQASAPTILDVGSGGGLPGIVLAVMLPHVRVACVDKVGKKAAFVLQAAGHMKLNNLQAYHGRVEQLPGSGYELVTARAVGSLAELTQWTAHCLRNGGVWAAMKGAIPVEEIASLPPSVSAFHVEQVSVPGLSVRRCIVWMRPSGGAATPA